MSGNKESRFFNKKNIITDGYEISVTYHSLVNLLYVQYVAFSIQLYNTV
jgi:hypothetical protein